MLRNSRNHPYVLVAAFAMLSLRALTPDGYMPGSQGSGLLFELCPSGMPPDIMRLLSGAGHHRHHHDDASGAASVSGTEQCPIGHMLASAAATDQGASSDLLPGAAPITPEYFVPHFARTATAYRSRAPPA